MRTCQELINHKIILDWEIRFASKYGLTEAQEQVLLAERRQVGECCTIIYENKVLAQRELEERRYAITGIRTVSSKTNPVEWGTQTPLPSENKDNNSEEEEEEEESHEEQAGDTPIQEE